MILSLNIISIINLLLLSSIFFFKRGDNKSNILLSIVLLSPVFSHVFNMLVYNDLIYNYRYFIVFSFVSGFLWAPSLYFYVLFSIHTRKSFLLIDVFHLILPFFGFLCSTWLLLLPSNEEYLFFHSLNSTFPPIFFLLDVLLIVQLISYIIISWVTVSNYNKKLKHLFSDVNKLSARWLQELIIVFFILYLIVFIPFFIFSKADSLLIFFPICTSLCYAFVVYKTITCPVVFAKQELLLITPEETFLSEENEMQPSSICSNQQILDGYASLLQTYIKENRPYLNADLNIKMLSEQIGIGVHCLSETINKKFQKNFFDFINEYRVDEAKKILSSTDLQKYTIDSISILSGFGSRSSFYTAFKKHTGTSPGEYQKNIQN